MLSVTVASCNKNPTGDIVETDETVTVTAFAAPAGFDGDGCADAVGFTLESPLGDRAVIDGTTGRTVEIRRQGRAQSGDLVSVLVDQPLPDGATDTATAHVEPSTLAERWRALAALGPPPVFDPERTFAVVITAADSSSARMTHRSCSSMDPFCVWRQDSTPPLGNACHETRTRS